MPDYGRPPPYGYPPYGGGPPPPPFPGAPPFWDPYTYPYLPAPFPPVRRDEAVTARRLAERISGYAPGYEQPVVETPIVPASAGLPAKPMAAATLEPGPGGRRNNRGGSMSGPQPPPPPDAKEDPRAAAGRKVSYHDMDLVAEGDVELTY